MYLLSVKQLFNQEGTVSDTYENGILDKQMLYQICIPCIPTDDGGSSGHKSILLDTFYESIEQVYPRQQFHACFANLGNLSLEPNRGGRVLEGCTLSAHARVAGISAKLHGVRS